MKSKTNSALMEAKEITSSLKRVRHAMELGVNQAEMAVSTLMQDGQQLADTLDEHKYHLKDSLATTKSKIDTVKSAEFRERYSVFLSTGFFTLVVVFVIMRRTRLLYLSYITVTSLMSLYFGFQNQSSSVMMNISEHMSECAIVSDGLDNICAIHNPFFPEL